MRIGVFRADRCLLALPPASLRRPLSRRPTPPDPGKLVIRPGGKGVEAGYPRRADRRARREGRVHRHPARRQGRPHVTTQVANPSSRRIPRPDRNRPQACARPAARPAARGRRWQGRQAAVRLLVRRGVDGQRIGYVHWAAKEVEEGREDVRRRRQVPEPHRLPVRAGRSASGARNRPSRRPTARCSSPSMRQGIGKDQALALSGMVDGKTLKIKGDGAAEGGERHPVARRRRRRAPASRRCSRKRSSSRASRSTTSLHPAGQPGGEDDHHARGRGVAVLWPKKPARKLLRFVTKMEPVGQFKLPPATTWVDAETFEPLKLEFDFPGLGGRVVLPAHHQGRGDRARSRGRSNCSTPSRSGWTARFREYTAGVASSTRCRAAGRRPGHGCSRPTPGSR